MKSIKTLSLTCALITVITLFTVLSSRAQVDDLQIPDDKNTKPKNCYCNIGGFCETNGGGDFCGAVYGGGGGYQCGAGSGNCD